MKRVLVVGAGFAGLVMAERLCAAGHSVTVCDKRDHVGGNSADEYDSHGILVHRYGPHYFRSDAPHVVEYLSRFTEWIPAAYRVKASIDGRLWSFPINLATYEQLVRRPATEEEFKEYLAGVRVDYGRPPENSQEAIVSRVGWLLYESFFAGYTRKQWGVDASQLDPSVCRRVPIRTDRDDRYLREDFQAMPADGYSALFARLIASTPLGRLRVILDHSFREVAGQMDWDHLVWTGPIDAYYGHRFGRLPYRSLEFRHEHYAGGALVQPCVQLNYPGEDVRETRSVEYRHVTGQRSQWTTVVREYPTDKGDPFYPIPAPGSRAMYSRYKSLADSEPSVTFLGRLATYRYLNMDQVVASALAEAPRLITHLEAYDAVC